MLEAQREQFSKVAGDVRTTCVDEIKEEMNKSRFRLGECESKIQELTNIAELEYEQRNTVQLNEQRFQIQQKDRFEAETHQASKTFQEMKMEMCREENE